MLFRTRQRDRDQGGEWDRVYHQQGQLDDLLGPIETDNTRTMLTAREIPPLSYPVDPFLGPVGDVRYAPRASAALHDFESYQAGAFVAQELPGGFAAHVGYFTNLGRHILERTFDNAIDPATGSGLSCSTVQDSATGLRQAPRPTR